MDIQSKYEDLAVIFTLTPVDYCQIIKMLNDHVHIIIYQKETQLVTTQTEQTELPFTPTNYCQIITYGKW